MPKTRGEIKMTKKISKKELKRLKEQMGVSDIRHNRPPVGRPAVFYYRQIHLHLDLSA